MDTKIESHPSAWHQTGWLWQVVHGISMFVFGFKKFCTDERYASHLIKLKQIKHLFSTQFYGYFVCWQIYSYQQNKKKCFSSSIRILGQTTAIHRIQNNQSFFIDYWLRFLFAVSFHNLMRF